MNYRKDIYEKVSHLRPVKAVNFMNKSTVPISIISKATDLWYKQSKKHSTTPDKLYS